LSNPDSGWGALFSGTNAVRSLVLAGGVVLHAINVFISTTIMPSVVADIGGLDYYAWSTTLFVTASILSSALSARLLHRSGPRGAFAIAATIFAAGTLICGAAFSMPVMLVGRTVQGFGGGFLFALAYAMIQLAFDKALWPRAMTMVSAMWGMATLIGPAIGGVFAELGIWRAAFWSVAPLALLFALLAAKALPAHSRDDQPPPAVPFTQLALLTAAVLAVSMGSIVPRPLWNVAGVVGGVLLTALLITLENRARRRLLPRGAFGSATPLSLLYIAMSLLSVAVVCSELFLPLFLQVLHQLSPLVAGYLTALMSVGWTSGSLISSGAGGRGIRRAILAAPLLSLIGMLTLALLLPGGSAHDWRILAPVCLAFSAIGFGVGLAWPHLLTRVLLFAPFSERNLASASITTVQMFATAFGAALGGMVANLAGLTEPGGLAGTGAAARWVYGLFALAPALCLWVALRVARLRPPHAANEVRAETP